MLCTPHQRQLLAGQVATDQRQVDVALHLVAVGHQLERTEFGLQLLLVDTLDGVLVEQAVVDQIGDGADLEAVLLGEGFEFVAPGHGAVVVHHLADHPALGETGHARQVAGGLGVAGTRQHAAGLGHQRKHVAGADHVAGLGVLGDGGLHGARAVGGGDARC